MISDEIKNKIVKWAKKEPHVVRAYVFGSRARNDFKNDSDLDIAVEIIKSPRDGNLLGTWIGIGENMKKRLSKAVPEFEMDLQWSNEEFSPIVFKGVAESSYLIYEENN